MEDNVNSKMLPMMPIGHAATSSSHAEQCAGQSEDVADELPPGEFRWPAAVDLGSPATA